MLSHYSNIELCNNENVILWSWLALASTTKLKYIEIFSKITEHTSKRVTVMHAATRVELQIDNW